MHPLFTGPYYVYTTYLLDKIWNEICPFYFLLDSTVYIDIDSILKNESLNSI